MTGFAWRSAWTSRLGIPGAVLTCVLAACASAVAPPAAGGVEGGPAPAHRGFSCRGPVLRHPRAKAYVVGRTAIIPVDLATGKAGHPLASLADDPIAIAISRDGRTAYADTADSVVPINVTTNAVGKPIATPGLDFLYTIAITPDGRTAYLVGDLESADGQTETPGVLRIDLTHGIAGKFLPVPAMYDAAVAPDGRMAYVATGTSVVPVSLVTGKASKPIKMPAAGGGTIAITPDGRTAYVGFFKPEAPNAGIVVPIDLAAGTAGTPIHVPNYPYSIFAIAITANDRTAYATNLVSVIPIHLATRKAGRSPCLGAPISSPSRRSPFP